MTYTDAHGNNLYRFDLAAAGLQLGAVRQWVKLAPVVRLCQDSGALCLVDVGCGLADVAAVLRANGGSRCQVIGVDLQPGTGVTVVGNVWAGLPLRTGWADLVVGLDLVQNVPVSRRTELYEELCRIARSGGVVYLFFRTDVLPADLDHTYQHVAGESPTQMRDWWQSHGATELWQFGTNAVRENVHWRAQYPMFPEEFSRVLYSDTGPWKFMGIAFRKP